MIQKEVAERIAAPPGSKTYGILSVLLQAFYDVKIAFHGKRKCIYSASKSKKRSNTAHTKLNK